MRSTGTTITSTTLGESVKAFVPHPLPPAAPPLVPESFAAAHHAAETALARLAGVAGLVPSVDWLLYSAIRKEALLTSQIEGTQATLTDLFDEEAGLAVSNTDDVEEVTNYLRGFRLVQDELREPAACPSACACCAMRTASCSTGCAARASSPVSCAVRKTGSAAPGPATRCLCRRHPSMWRRC